MKSGSCLSASWVDYPQRDRRGLIYRAEVV
jgi:hypothetical protein